MITLKFLISPDGITQPGMGGVVPKGQSIHRLNVEVI